MVTTISIAVLQYHLYDVRVVVQRVAVYGALAGVVTLLFLAVYSLALAGASTQLGDTRLRWIALVVAAAAVVLLAEPARRWLGARLEWRFLESGTSRCACSPAGSNRRWRRRGGGRAGRGGRYGRCCAPVSGGCGGNPSWSADGNGRVVTGARRLVIGTAPGHARRTADERAAQQLASRLRTAAGEIRRLAYDLQLAASADGTRGGCAVISPP